MVVQKINCDVCNENCYIVYDKTNNDAIIIDPGSNFDEIKGFIINNSLNVLAVLLTHGHFDHIYSSKKLQEMGYKIAISNLDSKMCTDVNINYSKENNVAIDSFIPDMLIDESVSELKFGSILIKVLHTPGHSMGGLSYIIENNLFSGDTMFSHGYGRTDLYGGDFKEIALSIKCLRKYTKNGYKLFPGHDY